MRIVLESYLDQRKFTVELLTTDLETHSHLTGRYYADEIRRILGRAMRAIQSLTDPHEQDEPAGQAIIHEEVGRPDSPLGALQTDHVSIAGPDPSFRR